MPTVSRSSLSFDHHWLAKWPLHLASSHVELISGIGIVDGLLRTPSEFLEKVLSDNLHGLIESHFASEVARKIGCIHSIAVRELDGREGCRA